MTNKELYRMMVWLNPLKPYEPGNGYEYIHVMGTDEIVERHEDDDWSVVADWKTSETRECSRDVIMWRKLVVYPHEKIIGRVRRELEL